MNKKISVIVTVYNRLEYLRNMIVCLNQQTVSIHELIIADDGSSQKVLDFIGDLIEECSFSIKHVYQEDLGFRLSKSRNNGAKNSTGDYLIFLDQDVIFDKTFIEDFIETSEPKKIVCAKGLYSSEEEKLEIQRLINEKGQYSQLLNTISKEELEIKKKQLKRDKINNLLYKFRLRKNRGAKMVGMCFGLSKSDYLAIDGFDEAYEGWGYEDDDFCNRAYSMEIGVVPFEKQIIHMYHPFDPTKRASVNEEYYYKRKKEIFKKKVKIEKGYSENLKIDDFTVTIYN